MRLRRSAQTEAKVKNIRTCGIIGSSSIFDISLQVQKLEIRRFEEKNMPVVGVPQPFWTAIHVFLENSILSLLVSLHRE